MGQKPKIIYCEVADCQYNVKCKYTSSVCRLEHIQITKDGMCLDRIKKKE